MGSLRDSVSRYGCQQYFLRMSRIMSCSSQSQDSKTLGLEFPATLLGSADFIVERWQLPLLARNGPERVSWRCLLLGVEPTCRAAGQTSQFDPYRKSAQGPCSNPSARPSSTPPLPMTGWSSDKLPIARVGGPN
jgi:hypothetical protein